MDGQEPVDEIAALLLRCAASDAAAFRRLYELQSARLYGVALRITRQPSLATDAVHDALLQVWRNAARFDPARGGGSPWLLSLVRYRALDIVGRRGREVSDAAVPERADDAPDPLARLSASQQGQALRRCLDEVEADRRRLVVLAFVEGLTHAEVAGRTGQPLGTVKSTIRRALQGLRTCLERTIGSRA